MNIFIEGIDESLVALFLNEIRMIIFVNFEVGV